MGCGCRVAVMANRRRGTVVGDTQRLFYCDRCHAQVVICQRCDRGNRYCGEVCARAARRDGQRASNRRYQTTSQGRQLHAERQARYRRRTSGKPDVTERGRQTVAVGAPEKERNKAVLPAAPGQVCPVCGASRTSFLRLGPRKRPRKARLSYIRDVRRPARSARRARVHPG